MDEGANASFSGLGAIAIYTVLAIIGAVIVVKVLVAMAPSWFGAAEDLHSTLANATTGDDDADSIIPIISLIVGFLFVLLLRPHRRGRRRPRPRLADHQGLLLPSSLLV